MKKLTAKFQSEIHDAVLSAICETLIEHDVEFHVIDEVSGCDLFTKGLCLSPFNRTSICNGKHREPCPLSKNPITKEKP